MATRARPKRPPYGGGRDALLMAAIGVVATRGLRGLTIRAVAEKAGVSHGLVRHHFGSRDAMVEATLIRSVELAIDTTSLEPGTGTIDDMATDLPEFVDSDTELIAFQYECLLEARRRDELMPHVRDMYDDYMDAARRELARAGLGDDPDLARVVFAALDGLALQQCVFGGGERTKDGVRLLHEMLNALREARARPSAAVSRDGARRTPARQRAPRR
jgi:AcrR family transcriptional regulator